MEKIAKYGRYTAIYQSQILEISLNHKKVKKQVLLCPNNFRLEFLSYQVAQSVQVIRLNTQTTLLTHSLDIFLQSFKTTLLKMTSLIILVAATSYIICNT